MKRPRIIMAGVGLAALAAAGGITAASASGYPGSTSAPRRTGRPPSAPRRRPSLARRRPSWSTARACRCTSTGPTRPRHRLSPAASPRLWPPLTSPAVAGAGVTGKLAVLKDVNGQQVTYNGHPLYTFADDQAGQVTGQGVQNFFVATPGIASITMSAGSTAPTTPAVQSGRYGY